MIIAKRLLPLAVFAFSVGLSFFSETAHADAPGLQINPLEYRDNLTPGHVKTGYVDVSNPGDSPINLEATVRGFRQAGTDGHLEFFDDPTLASAIKVDLPTFQLGAREAIRVIFNVNPAKLPSGGVYAAIFFRTLPPDQSAQSSYVAESANIGTLLELTNGPDTAHLGEVSATHIPFWQFGSRLTGALNYTNTDHSTHPIGFRPNLTVKVLPWGKAPKLDAGLVLPGSTRTFALSRAGSYFGLLPVIITDNDTHHTAVAWIFALTGGYQWALLVCICALASLALSRTLRHRFRK